MSGTGDDSSQQTAVIPKVQWPTDEPDQSTTIRQAAEPDRTGTTGPEAVSIPPPSEPKTVTISPPAGPEAIKISPPTEPKTATISPPPKPKTATVTPPAEPKTVTILTPTEPDEPTTILPVVGPSLNGSATPPTPQPTPDGSTGTKLP